MAYNELLADKLRQALNERKVNFSEKKMMGGLCIMVDDKMCVGVVKEDLMARIGPHVYEEIPEQTWCPGHGFYQTSDERIRFCQFRRLGSR